MRILDDMTTRTVVLYGRRLAFVVALLALGRIVTWLPDFSDDVLIDLAARLGIFAALALPAMEHFMRVEDRERDAADR
jgi:hypothetical protein